MKAFSLLVPEVAMRLLATLPVLMVAACFVSPDRLDELRGDGVVDQDHDGIAADVDCDDGNADVGDTIAWYADSDGDGFGTGAATTGGCEPADGFAAAQGDCDDADDDRFPGHTEVANDGTDQDCNGADTVTCFADADHDGWGSNATVLAADGTCDTADGEATNDDDCADSDDTRYPGATEIVGDSIDQNCDGADTPPCYTDDDGDGFGDPLATITTNDCAGAGGVLVGTDCDDTDGTVKPGAAELCDGQVNACGGSLPANETDSDGDGTVACAIDAGGWDGDPDVTGGGDCDPANGATHPGATEICDGLVNLCGGSLPANEIDGDDDGYVGCAFASGVTSSNWGNAETPAVVGGGDCDPANGATHPGAAEICDGKVNTCGGSLPSDEIDGDDDGYVPCVFAAGITSSNWGHAETPAVAGDDDCDDADATRTPGATEVCDGFDNDCDLFDDELEACTPIVARQIAPLSTATATSQTPTLYWAYEAPADGALVQICADRACTDVEYESEETGTTYAPPDALSPGVHYWRLWGRAGDSEALAPSPTWEFFVGHRSAPRDTSHGSVPDYNGDGYADLVVGARGYPTGSGHAYVYYGGPDGLSATADQVLDPPSDGEGEFGGPPGNAGDVDGDGYGDLIVGAPAAPSGGRAFVYFGSASGLPADPDRTLTCPATSPTRCGEGANGVGDVNGDGFADVAVGAGGDTEAYVFLGSADGPSTAADATLTGISGTTSVYYRIWGGDLDGDDLSDILVTAPAYNGQRGRVYVFNGSATTLPSAPTDTIENHIGDGTLCSGAGGWCAVGDWNGDGWLDLAAAIADLDDASPGLAHLYYGTSGGLPATPSQTLGKPATDTTTCCFATNTYDAGDVDGDGYRDLLVADFIYTFSGDQRYGQAWLFRGGASGVAASPSAVFAHLDDADRYLGFSGGGADFDGDAFSDVVVGNQRDSTDGRAYIYPGGEEGPATSPSVQLFLSPAVSNSWYAQWMAL